MEMDKAKEVFEAAHAFTMKWEGGLCDVEGDRGGITKYGCSIAFLREFAKDKANRCFLDSLGIDAEIEKSTIRAITKAQVKEIFKREFWDGPRLHVDIAPRAALLLYDCGVNSGTSRAVKIAQQGFNNHYFSPLLKVDGILGPKTRAALGICPPSLAKDLTARRMNFLSNIAAKPGQQKFLAGWHNRVRALEELMLDKLFDD